VHSASIRAGFVDDHPMLLTGLVHGLSHAMPELIPVLSVSAMADLFLPEGDLQLVEELDLVLLDLNLGDATEAESNVSILSALEVPVLIYTQDSRPSLLRRCLRAGAWGVVSKDQPLETLVEAIRTITSGEPYLNLEWATALASDPSWNQPSLSAREADVLRLYAAGLPAKSVARQLGISYETVTEYLQRIRKKYVTVGRAVSSRTDLYIAAVEDGHLDPPRLR
jgi:DNA-binding NarL/FixJ family response regulator